MIAVYDMANIAKKILGEQKIDTQRKYRLLKFCYIKKIETDIILYNNLTKKLIILSEEEKRKIESLPSYPAQILNDLIKDWFLVPTDFNEHVLSDGLYETLKLINKKNHIDNYVIFTTTNCNARCFYCFEHGLKRVDMSNETAKNVADFIEKKSKKNPVKIKWFGGEPLYNQQVIDIICNDLKHYGVNFISEMTTNAYLFNDSVINKAKENWNLKSVQITLDGTEKIYNKIKAYIHSENTNPFFVVNNNIENILKQGIKVTIRLNITEDNIMDLYKLVDYLSYKYKSYNNLNIYAANLYDVKKNALDVDVARINAEYFDIDSYICQKGLYKYNLENWNSFSRGCMAQNDNSVVISPEGLLGKCEHFTEGEMMYGSIYNSDFDLNRKNYWKEHNRIDACYKCVFYPNCFGEGHCPNLSLKCELAEKVVKEHNLEQSVVNKYYEYKNNN